MNKKSSLKLISIVGFLFLILTFEALSTENVLFEIDLHLCQGGRPIRTYDPDKIKKILSTREEKSIPTEWYDETLSLTEIKKKLPGGMLNSCTNAAKGFVGERATDIFFQTNGYISLESLTRILPESVMPFDISRVITWVIMENSKIEELKDDEVLFSDQTCTSKKGPDNGIDGIYFHKDDVELFAEGIFTPKHSIIINEAKFRSGKKNLSIYDFGVKKINDKLVRQSHSEWNKAHFGEISCLKDFKYDSLKILRTASLLNDSGELRLYEITDRDVENQQAGDVDQFLIDLEFGGIDYCYKYFKYKAKYLQLKEEIQKQTTDG